MLCRHKPESATSAHEVLGGQPWRSRCCNGPKGKQCVYVHELRGLRMPLKHPSGRGYDDSRFFEEEVCIYLGQQHGTCIKDLVQYYGQGVPTTELPSWYHLKVWVDKDFPLDFPFMRDTWDFGCVQLKEEWLRYMGMKRLPFETEWLLDRLAERRKYLALERLGPLAAPMSLSYTVEGELEEGPCEGGACIDSAGGLRLPSRGLPLAAPLLLAGVPVLQQLGHTRRWI